MLGCSGLSEGLNDCWMREAVASSLEELDVILGWFLLCSDYSYGEFKDGSDTGEVRDES